jgi:hypothetical protein
MADDLILLSSSNSTKEYMLDVLEEIGRPRKSIMYCRYRQKWVDPDLWNLLPEEKDRQASDLVGYPILALYVYQEILQGSIYEWQFLYPVRFGKLKECYKTGKVILP